MVVAMNCNGIHSEQWIQPTVSVVCYHNTCFCFCQNHKTQLMYKLGIGFCSGTLASMANIPFDVAKSRIQGPQPKPGVIKYRSTFASVAMVYREEGCVDFVQCLLIVL